MSKILHHVIYAFGSVLYSGRSPVASGTAGSLVSLIPLMACAHFLEPAHYALVLSVGIVVFILLGIPAGTYIEKHEGKEDPGVVVIDEAAGQWITFLFVSPTLMIKHPWIPVLGFLLFRIFDIVKFFPAKQAERLGGGLGIMADDVMRCEARHVW